MLPKPWTLAAWWVVLVVPLLPCRGLGDADQPSAAELALSPIEKQVRDFYMLHNPDKLERLGTILFRYKGREAQLLADLHSKYAGLPPYEDRKAAERAEAQACAARKAAEAEKKKREPRRVVVFNTAELRAVAAGTNGGGETAPAAIVELDPDGKFVLEYEVRRAAPLPGGDVDLRVHSHLVWQALRVTRSLRLVTRDSTGGRRRRQALLQGVGSGGSSVVEVEGDGVRVELEQLVIIAGENRAASYFGSQKAVKVAAGNSSVVFSECDISGQVFVGAGALAELRDCLVHDSQGPSGVVTIGGRVELVDTSVERCVGKGIVSLNGGVVRYAMGCCSMAVCMCRSLIAGLTMCGSSFAAVSGAPKCA
jgi:hypothetical protein